MTIVKYTRMHKKNKINLIIYILEIIDNVCVCVYVYN